MTQPSTQPSTWSPSPSPDRAPTASATDAYDLGVRYHAPRRREPGPVVGVAVSLLIVLVGAQLALVRDELVGPEEATGVVAVEQPSPAGAVAPSTGTSSSTSSTSTPAADPGSSGSTSPVVVSFGSGADIPVPGAADLLDGIAQEVLADPDATVTVVGHAEDSNDRDLEKQLSLQRALRVVDLLDRRGVPPERVQVVAAGSSRSDGADAANRRVTVEVEPG